MNTLDSCEEKWRETAITIFIVMMMIAAFSFGVKFGDWSSYQNLGVERETITKLKQECGDNCVPSIIYLPVAEEK